jgi:phage tail-like protein
MDEPMVHYAVVRDRADWDCAKWVGLEVQDDGILTLAQVPGTMDGKPIVRTGASGLSGIAIGDCRDLFLSDTAHQFLVCLHLACEARTIIPGITDSTCIPCQSQNPMGLLLAHHCLYVADSNNSCIQILRLPSLEVRATWEEPLRKPIALAADSTGRIYVLDRALKGVRRFDRWGALDKEYSVTMDLPVSLAIDAHNRLYVTSDQSDQIHYFDDSGKSLEGISNAEVKQPRAMAIWGNRLYVADEANHEIWVLDTESGAFLGALPGYRGPVAALAVDQAGDLYVKPGLDDAYLVLTANMAYAATGYVTAGPFDAGVGNVWERAHVDVDLPDGTDASLRIFTAAGDSEAPNWTDPQTLAISLDTLVANVVTLHTPPVSGLRYLWMRVELQSDDQQRATPLLKQIQAETTAESYLDYLPAVYRRDDAPGHFLERWLALFRAQLGDLEQALTDMPRHFDPLTAQDDELHWLASWLGFDPPLDLTTDELRKLLTRVPELCERRGTPQGIRDFIEEYTGVRPALFESFHERHVWQLGYTSLLGWDTALAAGLPDGMIVPGFTLTNPSYQGLRGDYYAGTHFNDLISSRVDPKIDFAASDWKAPPVEPDTGPNPNAAHCFDCPDKWPPQNPSYPSEFVSVRWTGQLTPSESKRYTFYVTTDGDVWFWLDGLLLIKPSEDPSPIYSAAVELEVGRWYAIQLEFRKKTSSPFIQLSWSSRNQMKQVIPQSQFCSVRDEGASFELPAEAQTLLVGQTVVGESGPLEKSDFGMPLYSETAHLFTVIVPAMLLPCDEQRALLKQIIEQEKPAHTDYNLCFVEARMRVGSQSTIGVDSYIAAPPEPMSMSGSQLGMETYLGTDSNNGAARIGQTTRVGEDLSLGQRRLYEHRKQHTETGQFVHPRKEQLLLRQADGRAPVPDGTGLLQSKALVTQPPGVGSRNPLRAERNAPGRQPCGCRKGRGH